MMNTSNSSLPLAPIIKPEEGQVLYGLGINPNSGDIIVSDAKDYVQNSTLFIYSNTGELQNEFESGIISGYFLFE